MTIESFWSKVDKQPGGCWLWTGGKTTAGYGTVNIDKRVFYTHRFSWKLHFGEIPKGVFVCHTCDRPSCVNPSHLFLGTARDNSHDALFKGRLAPQRETFKRLWKEHWADRRGENIPHKFSDEIVREIRSTYKKGVFGYKRICKKFNISFGVAQRIIARKTWAHIK